MEAKLLTGRGLRQSPQIKGLLRRYPIGSSHPVSFRKGAMRIGPDTYWVAALISQHDAKALVRYVATRGDQKPSPEGSKPEIAISSLGCLAA